ncbi:predicted protein [Lichtheimia corymbifera JMRC:FSU:9682]|uniref:Uncharacterized protein n=1 Tax=Lichtheimia corymbifera JMRC:FSU:9682 TaxID=1263082 RepID=A0A068RRD3_9FUNG|nr:predicted protein [Lichtheimia corymbifera JMRC:FSU:9682]
MSAKRRLISLCHCSFLSFHNGPLLSLPASATCPLPRGCYNAVFIVVKSLADRSAPPFLYTSEPQCILNDQQQVSFSSLFKMACFLFTAITYCSRLCDMKYCLKQDPILWVQRAITRCFRSFILFRSTQVSSHPWLTRSKFPSLPSFKMCNVKYVQSVFKLPASFEGYHPSLPFIIW